MKTQSGSFRLFASVVFVGLLVVPLCGQTPVLRWAFDSGHGAPVATTWISGGVLAIKPGTTGHVAFQPAGGVGPSTPGVFNGVGNVYGKPSSVCVNSAESPLIADAELAQFVVTMWIKPTLPPSEQPYARLLNLSAPESEKSKPGLFVSLNNSNIEVAVNGGTTIVTLPPNTIKTGVWTFVCFVYDGLVQNPYYSPEMKDVVGGDHNGAILTGSVTDPVKLAGVVGVNTGGPGYNVTTGPLEINGLSVAVGSGNGNASRAFCGLIDEVRIYSGLLSTAQIEAVRRSTLAP